MMIPEPAVLGYIGDVDGFMLNGSALAYVGDAVYELMVRSYVLEHGSKQPDRLHKHTTALVNAKAQSDMINAIKDELTEEELGIFKRGRNSSTATSAKNQSVTDYRRATGLEALFGYLYLSGRFDRMRLLFELGLERTGTDKSKLGQDKANHDKASRDKASRDTTSRDIVTDAEAAGVN